MKKENLYSAQIFNINNELIENINFPYNFFDQLLDTLSDTSKPRGRYNRPIVVKFYVNKVLLEVVAYNNNVLLASY